MVVKVQPRHAHTHTLPSPPPPRGGSGQATTTPSPPALSPQEPARKRKASALLWLGRSGSLFHPTSRLNASILAEGKRDTRRKGEKEKGRDRSSPTTYIGQLVISDMVASSSFPFGRVMVAGSPPGRVFSFPPPPTSRRIRKTVGGWHDGRCRWCKR